MKNIEDLKRDLKNNNVETRKKAVEELVKMAAEGDEEAGEVLYEVLETETETSVLQKVFEAPIQSLKDRRSRFFLTIAGSLNILPLIKKGRLSKVKNYVIERAKEVAELDFEDISPDGGSIVYGDLALSILAELLDADQMYAFVDSMLRKIKIYWASDHFLRPLYAHPEVLEKILDGIKKEPDAYSNNFVKIFDWFLENPHPSISKKIGELWLSLPSNFKEAIRLHYYKETERFYEDLHHLRHEIPVHISFPQKHPFLQWLEGFERGVVTSSPSSFSSLQAIAERIGLYLKDDVRQVETEKPSPISIQRREREVSGENVELIPIDKLLGEYFPQDQLIKLYMNEIRTIAKRLGVSVEVLRRIVELHEAAHAVVHLGRDANGRNFNTGAFNMVDSGSDPSPLHETLAQLLSYHCLKDIPELRECFEKLNEHQPEAYTLWKSFKNVNLERVRGVLIGMREGRVEASFEMFKKLIL